MFKLEPNPTFRATVAITVPGGESQPLQVVFRHKRASELSAFLANAKGRTDAEMLREMVASVPESEKAEGQADADFLASLLENYPAAGADLLRAYLREHTESRAKN